MADSVIVPHSGIWDQGIPRRGLRVIRNYAQQTQGYPRYLACWSHPLTVIVCLINDVEYARAHADRSDHSVRWTWFSEKRAVHDNWSGWVDIGLAYVPKGSRTEVTLMGRALYDLIQQEIQGTIIPEPLSVVLPEEPLSEGDALMAFFKKRNHDW